MSWPTHFLPSTCGASGCPGLSLRCWGGGAFGALWMAGGPCAGGGEAWNPPGGAPSRPCSWAKHKIPAVTQSARAAGRGAKDRRNPPVQPRFGGHDLREFLRRAINNTLFFTRRLYSTFCRSLGTDCIVQSVIAMIVPGEFPSNRLFTKTNAGCPSTSATSISSLSPRRTGSFTSWIRS